MGDEREGAGRVRACRGSGVDSYLVSSVYGWACHDGLAGNDEVTGSERFIGWLTLLFQGVAYVLLIKESGDPVSNASYSVESVMAAMYLLVATASTDLSVGYSLLVDGPSPSFRVFGAALLIVFGLMVTAATRMLYSGSEDNAKVIADSVTVLFIADLDEKALCFFNTMPRKWRLFWAIELVSISFCLALAGVVYAGEAAALFNVEIFEFDGFSNLVEWGSWFFWWVNPAAVTVFAFLCSHCLQRCLRRSRREPGSVRVHARKGGGFYFVWLLWLALGLAFWFDVALRPLFGLDCYRIPFPSAVTVETIYSSSSNSSAFVFEPIAFSLERTCNASALVVSNTALLVGLAVFAVRFTKKRRNRSINDVSGVTPVSSVPSLLVGWGLGYWVGSLLNTLMWFWPGSLLKGSLVGNIFSLVAMAVFFLVGVFTIADADFLGNRFERFIKPMAVALKNSDRVLYWTVMTVLRDMVFLWVFVMCFIVGPALYPGSRS